MEHELYSRHCAKRSAERLRPDLRVESDPAAYIGRTAASPVLLHTLFWSAAVARPTAAALFASTMSTSVISSYSSGITNSVSCRSVVIPRSVTCHSLFVGNCCAVQNQRVLSADQTVAGAVHQL